MEIRHPVATDLLGISLLLEQLGFPSSVDDLEARLKEMQAQTLLAVCQGSVVGMVTTNVMPVLHRPTAVGRLSVLIVAEQERGKGIGKALVEAAENMLRKRGCKLVEVTSNFRLEEAHAFYKHLGYEASSIRFKRSL